MITLQNMPLTEFDDATLVSRCQRGDREAFGEIVARYQTLICSLAYNFTGSLAQSEDLAQETFVTAWKQLAALREPAKLRSWLCGIARNLGHRNRRGREREPVHGAEPLEALDDLPVPAPHALEQAISREEEGILWRSLEQIPEIYREPMILFYREQESVERVAQALELSEETVRQRLVRGRKLLQERVLGFVEGALKKTSPGRTFTLGVLGALPLAGTSAKAAGVGAALVTGGAVVKGAALIGPLGGLLATVGGAFVSLRAEADDTKSPRERQFVFQMIGLQLLAGGVFGGVALLLAKMDYSHFPIAPDLLRHGMILGLYVVAMGLFIYRSRRRRHIQQEDNTYDEAEWTQPRHQTMTAASPAGGRPNPQFQGLKFNALRLVLAVLMLSLLPWRHHWGQALAGAAVFALVLFWSLRQYAHRPRYQSLRSGWVTVSPVVIGLMTLFTFDRQQLATPPGTDPALIHSGATVLAYNLVVVLVCAALTTVLAWYRRREFRGRQ